MTGDVAAFAAQLGVLATRLLEEPPGLLELLSARSEALHLLEVERLSTPARRSQESQG